MGHYACDMRPEWFSKDKERRRKKPKQWVDDWMGKNDVVLSERAYKALVRKLKRAAKEGRDGSR